MERLDAYYNSYFIREAIKIHSRPDLWPRLLELSWLIKYLGYFVPGIMPSKDVFAFSTWLFSMALWDSISF
jgi:hypothetical protein